MNWNYKSELPKSTGYEHLLEVLKTFNKDAIPSSDGGLKTMIDYVYKFYRRENIFPIYYYNEEGIKKELERCFKYKVKPKENNVINYGSGIGTGLCNFLFPNLFTVDSLQNEYKNKGGENALKRFHSEKFLKRAIHFAINSCKGGATPQNVFAGIRMSGVMPSNFRPMNARAIYEKYVPENGIIYDFACGFGGRMLGALSSPNNYKYFGVEPDTETFTNLLILSKYITDFANRGKISHIYQKGSEDFCVGHENYCDFAFSSPPYFNLEKYSSEETQCYNKYTSLEIWFEKYVEPTIKNIYYMLKPDSYYAVNIADFKINNKIQVNFVDRWIDLSKKNRFRYIENLNLKLPERTGNGDRKTDKKEGIFVFQN